MKRRKFLKQSSLFTIGAFTMSQNLFAVPPDKFISKRPKLEDRNFTSEAVEATIR